jgi:hypothetical protein
MSSRLWVSVGSITALILSMTSAFAVDLDYVTGGSLNIAYGTSAIQYRRNAPADHALYLTFGGPSVKLSFPEIDFTINASFFPSVRYLDDTDPGVNSISVILGFGPSFGYKSWILSFPFYFPDQTKTDMAIGIGYRL